MPPISKPKWLTTKKSASDIERDRQVAVAARKKTTKKSKAKAYDEANEESEDEDEIIYQDGASEDEESEASFQEEDDDDEDDNTDFSVHDDEEDEDSVVELVVPPPPKQQPKQEQSWKEGLLDSSSSEDDDLVFDNSKSKPSKPLATTTSTAKKPSTKSPHFAPAFAVSKKRPAIAESDDDDDESTSWMDDTHNNNSPPTKKNKFQPTVASTDWMDSPSPKQVSKKTLKKKNPFSKFAATTTTTAAAAAAKDSDDEDYDMAVALAMSESMKITTTTTKPADNNVNNNVIDKDDEPVWKEDPADSSSSEEDEQEDQDEYDEEKEAATSVLQAAEKLSIQVMTTMTQWLNGSDDHDQNAKGMIIEDGALALGNASIQEHNESKEWISQETMKLILPNVTLSNYQLIGVNWLSLLHGMECTIGDGHKNRLTNVNGILADEMGLGKTVQTIAFLAYLRHQHQQPFLQNDDSSKAGIGMNQKQQPEPHAPHLIIVPVSVLPNWVREFENFAPELNVVKYHGSLAEREEIQEDLRQYLPKKKKAQLQNKKWSSALSSSAAAATGRLDVILAPVSYFQLQKSEDRKFLNKFHFDYLVVDEAHMLKNSQSIRYKMLDRIKTRHRLLLTGTPVQNSPQELLNMLCFIMPLFSQGGGGGDAFADEENGNSSISERMLQHFVEHEKEGDEGNEEQAYKKLKQLFAPFVLRRKKSDVIAQLLPAKERVVELVDLDPTARSIYENILADHVNKSGVKVSAAIGEHLFTNLRKAATHPLLLRTRHTSTTEINHMTEYFQKYGAFRGDGSTKARIEEELSKFNDFHIHLTALELIDENPHRRKDLERYILPEQALFSSAKFSRLQNLLPTLIQDGHRILIFSVWTSCLDLLGCLVEYLGLNYLRMDGSCPSDVRQELIDKFNQDDSISIFLLSTKACGLGINLTAADTCIIHDLDFNPFNDLQAEDRCHRIGQKKKVTVYKMVTKDTVDADIYTMQERKSKMNAAIMESGKEKKARRELLQNAVKKFLGNPEGAGKKKKGDGKRDKENLDWQKEVVQIV